MPRRCSQSEKPAHPLPLAPPLPLGGAAVVVGAAAVRGEHAPYLDRGIRTGFG